MAKKGVSISKKITIYFGLGIMNEKYCHIERNYDG